MNKDKGAAIGAGPLVDLASEIIDHAWLRCEQQGGGERVLHSPCKWCVHGEIVRALYRLSVGALWSNIVTAMIGFAGGWFLAALILRK